VSEEHSTTGASIEGLTERLRIAEANFSERIAELELELEDRGWDRLYGGLDREFSRAGLSTIARHSALYYMKNPILRRAVDLENAYVFGQGVEIAGAHQIIDGVVQAFLNDELNRDEIATPRAMAARNTDLKLDGNLFIAFFTNAVGDVRVRTIPFSEIQDVISNSEDAKEPWYYLRRAGGGIASGRGEASEILYPDWQYTPRIRPESWAGKPIDWEHPVYHVSVNRLSGQKFGTPELYPAHDWARAYNEFLSNWATITRALARFAWKVATKGGASQRGAIKAALDSGISSGGDFNPAPATGSTWIETGESASLQPVRTAGATTAPSDGRRLLLMVCSAVGFPETFFGDAEVGTLATAQSLDRPTELAMLRRQRLWSEIIENVLAYAVEMKARAGTVEGLRGYEDEDSWGELKWYYSPDPEGEGDTPIDTHVNVNFPDIVERSVTERVDAVVKAATLGGPGFAGTLDPEYTTRKLLVALGEHSVDAVMAQIFPEDEQVPSGMIGQTEALRREMRSFLTLLKEATVAE
jgi:hypothetical protein